eukprot:743493-Pelagomonas_calceolata.AAC.2
MVLLSLLVPTRPSSTIWAPKHQWNELLVRLHSYRLSKNSRVRIGSLPLPSTFDALDPIIRANSSLVDWHSLAHAVTLLDAP